MKNERREKMRHDSIPCHAPRTAAAAVAIRIGVQSQPNEFTTCSKQERMAHANQQIQLPSSPHRDIFH